MASRLVVLRAVKAAVCLGCRGLGFRMQKGGEEAVCGVRCTALGHANAHVFICYLSAFELRALFPPHTSAMAHCNEIIKAVVCSWTGVFQVRKERFSNMPRIA